MDVVILAAGEGSRLNGITAPYMKPLLVVDRKPLIVHVVEQALDRRYVDEKVTLVCSPNNVGQIADVLEACGYPPTLFLFMVQPRPNGPAQALRIGLEATTQGPVMVLCADNLIEAGLTCTLRERVRDGQQQGFVCGRMMNTRDAMRYTWTVVEDKNPYVWHEHDEEAEGWAWPDDARCFVWLGPLVLPEGDEFYAAIGRGDLIGPVLSAVHTWELIEAECHDIGVPEAVT